MTQNIISYCTICGDPLKGRQKVFCSRKCSNNDTNNRNQNYTSQQRRGRSRKQKLVQMKGGCCSLCGYNKNYAALCFHHEDSTGKDFGIDLRKCSNSSWERLLAEVEKCILLCHNCHTETHHPEMSVEEVDSNLVVRRDGLEPTQ